jgi:hypothetical protein
MRRFTRLILLTVAAVFVATTPAGATTVIASEKYKWFYWAGPILFVMLLLVIAWLSVVYVRKIVIPRHRGRRVE